VLVRVWRRPDFDEMARSFAQLGRLPEGPTSEIDLSELMRQLLASDLPDSVTGTLHTPDAPLFVHGHLEALTRAFRNLLGNAVEALSERADSRIDVTITQGDGFVDIAIADNGPGVPPEHHGQIWFPDFTTKKRGTGLGLALVRQTVQAHGGSVELMAREGGACFIVRLPAGRRESM